MRFFRWLNPEFVLAFMVASAFWIAVLWWQAVHPVDEAHQIQSYRAATDAGSHNEEQKSFWERATNDPVAVFTLVLAASTIGLWAATIALYVAGERQRASNERIAERQRLSSAATALQQYRQMRRMLVISRASADAATKQAETAARQAKFAEDALFKLERPYILVTGFSYIKPPETRRLENGQIKIVSAHHVTYKIGNFGRMAALIHDVRHVFQVAPARTIPSNPFSISPTPRVLAEAFDAGYALAAGKIEDNQHFAIPNDIECFEKGGWIDPKLSSGSTIFMFIRVRYEDAGAVGPIRDYVSTWKYDFSTHYFLKCGGRQHNYEQATEPADH